MNTSKLYKQVKPTHNAYIRNDDLNFLVRVNGDKYNEWLLRFLVDY